MPWTPNHDSHRETGQSAGARIWTLSNGVSALRFPLAVAFVLSDGGLRAGVVAAAGVSDWLDGWIARRRGESSELGEVLDPVADKTFVATMLVTFYWQGQLATGQLLLLLLRDIYAVLGWIAVRAARRRIRLRARLTGKLTTALQIATGLALVVQPAWVAPLVWATAAAGVAASADYTAAALARRED